MIASQRSLGRVHWVYGQVMVDDPDDLLLEVTGTDKTSAQIVRDSVVRLE
jgi:hypothetical protein